MRKVTASLLIKIILASVVSSTLTGCRHGIIVKAPIGAPGPNGSLDPKTTDPGQYTVTDYLKDKTDYDSAVRAGSVQLDTAKIRRNDIVYGIMTQIEIVYTARYQHLFGGKNLEAVAGDFMVLGLSAGSTIATHAATKTILSALGTGFSGLTLSIDKNYYSEQSFQVIGIAMQTRRDKIRAVIVNNLKEDVTIYPLNAAKRDLMAYLQAGTLASGLQELQEEAGAATAKQDNNKATVPDAPAGLAVNPGVTQNALSWGSVSTATSYTIYFSPNAGVTKSSSKLPSVTVPFTTHTGLTAGDSYFYAVTASNNVGESALSNEASGQPLSATSTSPSGGVTTPAHVRAVMIGSTVTLFWDASAGAQHYIVNRNIMNGTTVTSSSVVAPNVTTNTFTDPAAGPTGTTTYSVIAVDANDNQSSPSPAVAPSKLNLNLNVTGMIYTPH